jgi:hypothetical protein
MELLVYYKKWGASWFCGLQISLVLGRFMIQLLLFHCFSDESYFQNGFAEEDTVVWPNKRTNKNKKDESKDKVEVMVCMWSFKSRQN